MKVFITGASGTIGSVVTEELVKHGHEVAGLARSDAAAAKVEALGGTAVRGALGDLDVIAEAAAAADGAIHLAFSNDFTRLAESIAEEGAAIDAIGEALADDGRPAAEGRPFVIVSGTTQAAGRLATEADPLPLDGPVAGRSRNVERALALKDRGVRTSALRLPRSVHEAHVAYGFAGILIQAARQSGVSAYVGDGQQRWPAVHRRDAASLARLLLEKAEAGTAGNAVSSEGDTMLEIATVIGEQLGLPVQQVPAEQFGPLGLIFAVDQPASAAWTRETFGWEPVHPTLLDDLRAGGYPE